MSLELGKSDGFVGNPPMDAALSPCSVCSLSRTAWEPLVEVRESGESTPLSSGICTIPAGNL